MLYLVNFRISSYIKELICGAERYTDVIFFVNTPVQAAESIVISETPHKDDSISYVISTQSIPLSNGILYTNNKAQFIGQLHPAETKSATMGVANLKAIPATKAQEIQKAVFSFFMMPPVPTMALVQHKKALSEVLEKKKQDGKAYAGPTDGTSTVSLLAESLHELARYSYTK